MRQTELGCPRLARTRELEASAAPLRFDVVLDPIGGAAQREPLALGAQQAHFPGEPGHPESPERLVAAQRLAESLDREREQAAVGRSHCIAVIAGRFDACLRQKAVMGPLQHDLGAVPGAAQAQSPQTHQHSFGAAVADIGAGTGYFAVRLANMVPGGRVYGVDVEPDMVKYLAERAKREQRANLVAIAGAPDDPRLPEKVDLALLVDVFHHIDERSRYFRKLRASLKPGGRVAIIDFKPDSPEGPPPAARIAAARVIAELQAAGYALTQEHRFLPYQYFLVFEPKRAAQR